MADHLVTVCCHAICHGGTAPLDPCNETNWALKPFQRSSPSKPGEHETFIKHILAAVKIKEENLQKTILVFSGGPTDPSYPTLSESQSYLNALLALRPRNDSGVLLEESATDSYQNVLFSIVAFRKHCGYYPDQITVITHAFKERRFLDLHAKALRWPADRIKVCGIDPPFSYEELERTSASETKNGYKPFEEDPYGTGPFLYSKRKERRWNEDTLQSLSSGLGDSVQQLLHWTGGFTAAEIFPHSLPWETRTSS